MKKYLLLALGMTVVMVVASCGPKQKIDVNKVADKNCMCCIEDALKPNRYIAALKKYSRKAKTMRLKINKTSLLVLVDKDTKFEGVADAASIKTMTCMIVDVKPKGEEVVATNVKVLPPLAERIKEDIVQIDFVKKRINTIPPKIDNFLLVDSRPAFAYNNGTIPGAVNITYPAIQKAKDLSKLLGADKNKEIIFFCGGLHCNLAPGSAIVAKNAGYTNVKVYHEGLPQWRKLGNPVCLKQKGFIGAQKKGVCMILIDLRKNAKEGHIPGAVGILPKDIGKWKNRFPSPSKRVNKVAPVVVYVQNNKHKGDVSSVLKTIFSWGFTNVSILDGGFDGYVKAGGKVEKNKLQNKIFYVKKLEPGEMYPRDFVKKVKKLGDNEILVDARPSDEFDVTHIPGAKNVPVTEFTKERAKELKSYKTVYMYCNTGLLAGMLFEKTQKAGLTNIKWLKNNVVFRGDKIEIGRHEKFILPNKGKKKAATSTSSGTEGC